MIVKLHDFIKGAIVRMVAKHDDRGNVIHARIEFVPGVEYTVEDPLLIDYLTGAKGDVRQKSVYSKDLIAELTANNIPYEISKCGTCSNAKPRVLYNPFKVLPDDGENEEKENE